MSTEAYEYKAEGILSGVAAGALSSGLRRAPHVYVAITAVTAAMAKQGISKSRNNATQGYKFRGIDDVYAALSSVLAENQLCILPRVLHREMIERPTKSGGVSSFVVVDVEFDMVSSVDATKHTIRTMGEAMDTADKATNKAMSAAMKYACLIAFQIPTEGDNDADAHHPEPAPSSPRKVVNSGFADPAVAAVMEGYAADIAKAIDASTSGDLMGVYNRIFADQRLAPDAKEFLKQKCSTRRRELQGQAA